MSIVGEAQKLAIAGGTPVAAESLSCPPWPPRSAATAQRLADVYLSGAWSFNGQYEQDFSRDFAAYHGAKHGIFMANGTVTLQCALGALGIQPGDEVIIPALTWPATAMAVHYVGAIPVFTDIEASTLCLDPQAFEAAITPRTRAVIPVHLYGGMADIEAINAIAARHGIAVIEDCAHAQGGKWNNRGLGSWGAVGSFSFQQSKTMACGEGGICLTNDDDLAERLFRAKHIGYAPATKQGQAASGPPPGLLCHNFRGTEFQAVILQDQLVDLDRLITLYNKNATRLEQSIAGAEGVRPQARGRLATMQSYYTWSVVFDEGPLSDVPLDAILAAAQAEGLGMGGTYGTVYNHTLYNMAPDTYRRAPGGCRVADHVGQSRTAVLPHQWLAADDATIDTIGEILVKLAHNADAIRAHAAAHLNGAAPQAEAEE